MDPSLALSPTNLSREASRLITKGSAGNQADIKAAARKAANEFETVFLKNMFEGMFAGLKTDPPFGGGNSEKVYRSMLIGEYAKGLSQTGGIGIADHVYKEILKAQEG